MSPEEVKLIALQGMAMAIAMHAIAPMTRPLFAELEGSAYAFASKLKANNRMQATLGVQAEALSGSRDFAKAQEYVGQEKAWLEERLRILDEVEAAARKESEPGAARPKDGGIAARIKMSAEDLSALRTDLQGKLGQLEQGTLPLATLEPKGPGLFTCPREHIRDVVRSLGEVQKTTVDPKTTVTTYEVKLPDNTVVKVMEKIDPAADWVAHLKSQLAPDSLARLEVELKGKTPQEIMDHFHGNVDVAVDRLSTPGGDAPKTAQDTLDVDDIPKEGKRIDRENRIKQAERLARAKEDAAARGKEPFDLARLETMCATEALGRMTPEERAARLEKMYYVEHPELVTLAEFARLVDELGRW